MWGAIASVLTALFNSVIGKWIETKNSKDAMAKAYFEDQNKELIQQMGKAYEKPDDYYHGDPDKLVGWVRQRSASENGTPES